MTQELLTALGANAEFGMRNSELPVGDGLPDVPQPRSGDRQRAVEGASPYGGERGQNRFQSGTEESRPRGRGSKAEKEQKEVHPADTGCISRIDDIVTDYLTFATAQQK